VKSTAISKRSLTFFCSHEQCGDLIIDQRQQQQEEGFQSCSAPDPVLPQEVPQHWYFQTLATNAPHPCIPVVWWGVGRD
jgi:hypothetical protein